MYVCIGDINRLPTSWYTKKIPIPICFLVFLAEKVGIDSVSSNGIFNLIMNVMEKVGILLAFLEYFDCFGFWYFLNRPCRYRFGFGFLNS